jgi:hypothetical protein
VSIANWQLPNQAKKDDPTTDHTRGGILHLKHPDSERALEVRCPRVCQSGHRGQSPLLAGRRVNEPCRPVQHRHFRSSTCGTTPWNLGLDVGPISTARRRLLNFISAGVEGAEPAPLKPAAPRRGQSRVLCVISTALGSSKSRFWKGIASEGLAGLAELARAKPQIPKSLATDRPGPLSVPLLGGSQVSTPLVPSSRALLGVIGRLRSPGDIAMNAEPSEGHIGAYHWGN